MRASVRTICMVAVLMAAVNASNFERERGEQYQNRRVDTGRAVGLFPNCPNILKNVTITPRTMRRFKIAMKRMVNGKITSQSVPIEDAIRYIANDKDIDLRRKKTVVYAVGYVDSPVWPWTYLVTNAYVKKGYNVFITETFYFFTNTYFKSARLARAIGERLGQFLIDLKGLGMETENLELVGLSLGAHVVSYAAKYFYRVCGEKPYRLTGLDPAGPCFRTLPPEAKLNKFDARFVDVVHTNIDGFGIAEPMGDVDFYTNGGEFQPFDIPFIPCLVICSHLKAGFFWWVALNYPKQFIAKSCDSVDDARAAKCYEDSRKLNYLGLETDFRKPGIYYLPTDYVYPYFRGLEGIKSEKDIFSAIAKKIDPSEHLVV